MKTVLVTAIGTVTATAVVRRLKARGGYRLIGADINARHEIATSLDVDEFYRFPLAVNDDYIPFALDFCRAHSVDYYYAVIDKEVVNLARNRERFEAVGTRLCVVNREFAEACHFKDAFGRWVARYMPEIAIRSYDSLDEARNAVYPLFIKPVEGVGSNGCRRIDSYDALLTAIDGGDIGRRVLVQDYVEGQNITVDCVRNRKTGQARQIQRRELLRNANGCGIAVEIFHDPELERVCGALMEKLDLNGVCNMEYFDTGSGYRIIEINPRFSAGTLYTCMAGVDTVLNAMRIADGEPCEFGEVAVGARFAERYEPYRMD